MSGNKVGVTPDNVRQAGNSAGDLADRLARIAKSAEAAVSAGSGAWGDDKFGSKFADGDNGFAKGSTNTVDSTSSLSESFETLSTGFDTTADRLTAMEQANADRFRV
ncbi:hypothetical protein [Nocardia sp. NPDC057668]|uniref:hypothetical protein n=1 Tax=Nocardia sp. NPDC057668 TaxID=3346202 RepID=UPI0036731A47